MMTRESISHWLGVCTALLLAIAIVPSALAAEEKAKKKSGRKKSYILSETTAKKMLKVGELAEADDFEGALVILDKLAAKSRLKPHDKAMVYQYRGFMQGSLERYEDAAKSFELALQQDALPDATTEMLRFNLAQLYMAEERFEEAIEMFELWLNTAQNPNANAEYYMTIAYAQTEQFEKALPHARLAVARSKKPTEGYMALLLAVEYQNGNLIETMDVLKQLATIFPRKRYYMRLAYGYSNMGEEAKALAMLELAEIQS